MASYPQQVTQKHWETNGQGSRPQSPVSPLIRHSEDTDYELQSQEYLYGGGHSHTDAWLKLKAYIRIRCRTNCQKMIQNTFIVHYYFHVF